MIPLEAGLKWCSCSKIQCTYIIRLEELQHGKIADTFKTNKIP